MSEAHRDRARGKVLSGVSAPAPIRSVDFPSLACADVLLLLTTLEQLFPKDSAHPLGALRWSTVSATGTGLALGRAVNHYPSLSLTRQEGWPPVAQSLVPGLWGSREDSIAL